jgi:hypothetical protein
MFMKPNFAVLPFLFLKFWFIEAPVGMLKFFLSLNEAFFVLFSLPMFIRTFFKPLKNEYRQGLVGFSIGMGIFLKSILIMADLAMLVLLLVVEAAVLFSFLFFPFATVWVLFMRF